MRKLKVPYGYQVHPDNDKLLMPIEHELEALELAKQHLKQYSYRAVAQWLSKETGRYISHYGLKKRIEVEQNVEKHLSLSASLPSGSKKRSRKSRSSKLKESVPTQKPVEIEAPQTETIPVQVAAPEYDVEEAQDVVFKPNAGPQTSFLSSSEREVLYGGAAGGGKSYAMLADPLHGLNDPNFSGLLVRHTTEELRELIQKSQELYPRAIPNQMVRA